MQQRKRYSRQVNLTKSLIIDSKSSYTQVWMQVSQDSHGLLMQLKQVFPMLRTQESTKTIKK